MKKLLNCAAIVFLCICILFISSCMSAEERERGRQIEATARHMILTYLYEKYGIEATIASIRARTTGSGTIAGARSFTGFVTAMCTYGGRTFYVNVDTSNGIIRDTFQLEDIMRDIAEYIQRQFSFDSHIVPQSLEVNSRPRGFSEVRWLGGWGKYQVYDGNMTNFISNISSTDYARTIVTLLFGVTADNKGEAIEQLIQEASRFQNLTQNRSRITLVLYDKEKFANENISIDEAMLNFDEFSLKFALGEIHHIATYYGTRHIMPVVTIFDYSYYFQADASDPFYIYVSSHIVDGNPVETKRFSLSSSYHGRRLAERWDSQIPAGIIRITDYFSYSSGRGGEGCHLIPDRIRVRINVVKQFPEEVAANNEFAVLDAREAQADSRNPVRIVPSLRVGSYLYFDIFRGHNYAIGIKN